MTDLLTNIWAERQAWQELLTQPASETLDVYIDMKSPHAYLAVRPSLQIAKDFHVRVNFMPYTLSYESLGVTQSVEADMQRRPGSPAADRKARMYYAAAREYAAIQSLPFRTPHRLLDSDLAHRVFLFAKQQEQEVSFVMWVYLQGWGSGWRNCELESMAQLRQACDQIDIDTEGLDAYVAANGPGQQQLQSIMQDAEAHGITGVPHYVFNDSQAMRRTGLFGREHLALIRLKYLQAGLARHPDVQAEFPHIWPSQS